MSQENIPAITPTQFLLILHSVPQLGEKGMTRALRLIAQQRLTPEACLALTAKAWKEKFALRAASADYLAENRAALIKASAETLRALRQYNVRVVSVENAEYPIRLDECDDAPPPILYAVGNYGLLEPPMQETDRRFTYALALSNDPSPNALMQQDSLGMALAEAGGIVVTGHDRQPYKVAALSAQRTDRPIVYVFDRGLREALGPAFDRPPFSAARIREAVFDPAIDLALSPFRLDDHGLGANNRRRDQIIFALADILIAVEVKAGGEMVKRCLQAHAQGKPVFVMAGGKDGNEALRNAGCPVLPEGVEWAKRAAQNRNFGPTPFV